MYLGKSSSDSVEPVTNIFNPTVERSLLPGSHLPISLVPTFQGLLGARRAYLLALQHSTSISNTIQVAARDNSVAKCPIPDLVAARGFTGHVPGKSVHADDVVASHRIEQHAARNTRLPAA